MVITEHRVKKPKIHSAKQVPKSTLPPSNPTTITRQQFIRESVYALPANQEVRPFEARQSTFDEYLEIRKELIRLKDGYYRKQSSFL